jgi:NAD(P)-dependent dehydrogenase (short-subunit alcohol dehydrogenase family)
MARVVIFGGTGGIGAAVAQQLVERGDSVHLVARDAARLEASASLLGATYTVGDVCDETLFARVANEAGDVVDGLVYAVGTITLRPLARLTSVQFEHDWRVNALGAALAIQALTPSLKRSDAASVVLFSSVAAAQGFYVTRFDQYGESRGVGAHGRNGRRVGPESTGERDRAVADADRACGGPSGQRADGLGDRRAARNSSNRRAFRYVGAHGVSAWHPERVDDRSGDRG